MLSPMCKALEEGKMLMHVINLIIANQGRSCMHVEFHFESSKKTNKGSCLSTEKNWLANALGTSRGKHNQGLLKRNDNQKFKRMFS